MSTRLWASKMFSKNSDWGSNSAWWPQDSEWPKEKLRSPPEIKCSFRKISELRIFSQNLGLWWQGPRTLISWISVHRSARNRSAPICPGSPRKLIRLMDWVLDYRAIPLDLPDASKAWKDQPGSIDSSKWEIDLALPKVSCKKITSTGSTMISLQKANFLLSLASPLHLKERTFMVGILPGRSML